MPQETNLREESESNASGRVLTVNVRPPIRAVTDPARKRRIGFVGNAFAGGGVERWLNSLIAITKHEYEWVGVGCEEFCQDRGSKMVGVPVAVGLDQCVQLAKKCDLLIVWCSEQLHRYAYESSAKLIGTWHSGPGQWTARRAAMMDWDLFSEIHVCSEYCVKSVPQAHKSRAKVIYNCVDASWIRPTTSKAEFMAAHDIPDDANLLTFIGRLSPEKGWGVAVMGASMAKNTHVIISGRPPVPSFEDGVRYAVSDLARNSTFVGWTPDIGNVLQCSRAIITPSDRLEACQYTVMEAALAGVPVISTPFGVVHDRPNVACEILPERPTISDVTEACNRVISGGQEIQGKIDRARLLIASEFNMVVWTEQWLRFLGSL